MKITIIIWVILYTSIAFAINKPNHAPTIETPNIAKITNSPQMSALNIIQNTLSSLKTLKKHKQVNIEEVRALIKTELLSNVAIDTATKLALKKHWNTLTSSQQSLFQQYIIQSLIKDYANIFIAYDKLDDLQIVIDPKIKRQDNKAIVKLIVSINNNAKPIILTLKMIQTDQWRIYDVVFSGVSLIKNYHAQFNSHIRRKGLESLVAKIMKK